MYSKIFLNSKFKFLRKCQNKSVCVRRFLRCKSGREKMPAKQEGKFIREKRAWRLLRSVGIQTVLQIFRKLWPTVPHQDHRRLTSSQGEHPQANRATQRKGRLRRCRSNGLLGPSEHRVKQDKKRANGPTRISS